MKALVTGAGGFVGGALVRALLARGDGVRAAVRSRTGQERLAADGVELVALDLARADGSALADVMAGTDAVFHVAGAYRIGISRRERAALHAANVETTRRVLDAALAANVPRIVYTSTANVLGNTHGQAPDESYRRPQPPRFVSYYDETKYLAHLLAEERIAAGAPILVAMPGMVYGPGDHSQAGAQIQAAVDGRMRAIAAGGLGGNLVHVDDVAAGHLLIHDRGQDGRDYLLGGERARMAEVFRRAAAIGRRTAPRLTIPDWLLRTAGALGGLATRLSDRLPALDELVSASVDVTYWFDDSRARGELGYAPRGLDDGLRTLLPA
ncbi:MAG TPA: NAD-dependent epimerase/dehydratase family protein [Candidatus Limnocylindria bacterium]|nr:NAD-dependent epimerase/dehydratase family protein [Candidatus Limnocylindria bacterium]